MSTSQSASTINIQSLVSSLMNLAIKLPNTPASHVSPEEAQSMFDDLRESLTVPADVDTDADSFRPVVDEGQASAESDEAEFHKHLRVNVGGNVLAAYCIDSDGDVVIPAEELGALLEALADIALQSEQEAHRKGLRAGAEMSKKKRKVFIEADDKLREMEASGELAFIKGFLRDVEEVLKK